MIVAAPWTASWRSWMDSQCGIWMNGYNERSTMLALTLMGEVRALYVDFDLQFLCAECKHFMKVVRDVIELLLYRHLSLAGTGRLQGK